MEIQNVSDPFGWLGRILKITGLNFGTAADNYVGLRVGSKVLELKTLQWSEKELLVQIPTSIPSRSYDLGVFKKPAQTPTPAPLPNKRPISFKVPGASENPPAPAPSPLPFKIPLKNIRVTIPALSNTINMFIALGPPVEDKKTSPVSDFYAQAHGFGNIHECEPEWFTYMDNSTITNPLIPSLCTFLDAFNAFKAFKQETYLISYEYEQMPLKPFESEEVHMKMLTEYLSLAFPGSIYKFKFVYGKVAPDAIQQPVVHVRGAAISVPGGLYDPMTNIIYCKTDSILIHEFAHSRGLIHHYANPGPFTPVYKEEKCLIAKQGYNFCRGCSVAMGLEWPLKQEAIDRIVQLSLEFNTHFEKTIAPPQ